MGGGQSKKSEERRRAQWRPDALEQQIARSQRCEQPRIGTIEKRCLRLRTGQTSEFWLYIDNVDRQWSAERVHAWIVGLLQESDSPIVGVQLLDDGEIRNQALVYCTNFRAAKLVCQRISGRALAGCRIAASCMCEPVTPDESKMRATQVMEKVSVNSCVRLEKQIKKGHKPEQQRQKYEQDSSQREKHLENGSSMLVNTNLLQSNDNICTNDPGSPLDAADSFRKSNTVEPWCEKMGPIKKDALKKINRKNLYEDAEVDLCSTNKRLDTNDFITDSRTNKNDAGVYASRSEYDTVVHSRYDGFSHSSGFTNNNRSPLENEVLRSKNDALVKNVSTDAVASETVRNYQRPASVDHVSIQNTDGLNDNCSVSPVVSPSLGMHSNFIALKKRLNGARGVGKSKIRANRLPPHETTQKSNVSLDSHCRPLLTTAEVQAVNMVSETHSIPKVPDTTDESHLDHSPQDFGDHTKEIYLDHLPCSHLTEQDSVTEGNRKRKCTRISNPCVVLPSDLRPSVNREEVEDLIKGKYPGVKKFYMTEQIGEAAAAFSSAEKVSSCANGIKGSEVDGKEISSRARITCKNDTKLDEPLLEDTKTTGVAVKLGSQLNENRSSPGNTGVSKKHDKLPSSCESNQKSAAEKAPQVEVRGKEEYVVKIGLLPPSFSPKQLYDLFSPKCPGIEETIITEAGCGEIIFDNKREMETCMKKKDNILHKIRNFSFEATNNDGKNKEEAEITDQEQEQRQEEQSKEQQQLPPAPKQSIDDDQPKKSIIRLLGEELIKTQQQEQRQEPQQPNNVTSKPKNHVVQVLGFARETDRAEILKLIKEKCGGVEIMKLVRDEKTCFVKLNSQDDCQKVHKNLQGSPFNGTMIKTMYKPFKSTKKNMLYVVVKNIPPNFEKIDIENIFKKCRGFLRVTKEVKTYARVYFESLDSVEEVVNQMNGYLVRKKKLEVTASIGLSEDIEWRKFDRKRVEYLAQLQRRRETLHMENYQKMKRLVEVPELRRTQKGVRLEEFERHKALQVIYEQKTQELIDQRNEFEKKYQQLLHSFNQQYEDHRDVDDKSGIKKLLMTHKRVTERECKKFEGSLPIYARRTEILETVGRSQVVVLVGETGSGKSTQLAQYLAEESFSHGGKVVVTQPRKIAATSLAKRVSEEYGCQLGEEVGYHVGLDKKMNKDKTIIKFVTDRILLNEVLQGVQAMQQYSCIIIDEAHERSIHTDLLVAMIKRHLTALPHLKLIVTSATLNTDIFRKYFDNCPLLEVQGRTFPVECVYTRARPADYVDGVYAKAVEVCESGDQGDMLVFLTQQNEIEKTCDKLEKKLGKNSIILPLHGKLQSDEQQKVFQQTPKGKRKIVVATNSAETSITIPGIRIVVDSGMVKEPSFDPARNMTSLDIKLVSRSSAVQRSGRAGRTGPGKCYCMYTENDFENMEGTTRPEILKMHLGMAVLQLLSLGVTDIEQFNFVQSPPREALNKALESLKQLGALDPDGRLNNLGEEMLGLPTEPRLSKALLEGLARGCGNDIITAVALMSSGHDVFYRGDTAEKRNECAIQKQEFCQTSGDLLSAIDVYKKWSVLKSAKEQAAWCKTNALNSKSLRAARETRNEIREALVRLRPGLNLQVTANDVEESLSKCILAGYFETIAWSFGHEKLGYKVLSTEQKARIHPSSVLSCLGDQPDWVLFQEIRRTESGQVFLLNITPVKLEWFSEVAMHALQYVDEEIVAQSRVVRSRLQAGPELVKAVIGRQGSTIKKIEASVTEHSLEYPGIRAQSAFCAVECNVDKGIVDVYTTEDCLEYACQQVNNAIEEKRRELEGYSEVVVSNEGGLKILVGNDLRTVTVVQPGTSCKFDVFVHKIDVSEEVDSGELVEELSAGETMIHYSTTASNGEANLKWGTVTYSDVRKAEEVTFILSQSDLYNVKQIYIKPSYFERITTPDYSQLSSVGVLISWFPSPAHGRAYIKFKEDKLAQEVLEVLIYRHADGIVNPKPKPFLGKKLGDIVLHVEETDDEFTVRKRLAECCTESQLDSLSKVIVPSLVKHVDLAEERANLIQKMREVRGLRSVVKVWESNRQKVIAFVLFDDLKSAEGIICELNGKMNELGARAMYMELSNRREVTCDVSVYKKIQKIVEQIKGKNKDVEIVVKEERRRRKMSVTGENAQLVQRVGATLVSLVTPEVVVIEDAAIARVLSSGYARGKMKTIEKDKSVAIRTTNFCRCIQITGESNAKLSARKQLENLIQELQKTMHVEVDLRSSERPVGAIREILKHFGKNLQKLIDGEDCQASLEIKRRKLVLRGAKEAVGKCQTKVEEFLQNLPNARKKPDVNSECPVCLADIEEPYLLKLCGHAYCSQCIGQYLTNVFSEVKRADILPLKCINDECGGRIIKEDYVSFLNTEQLEKLYRVSLECFVIGSERFEPCPTADCTWVYEITSTPSVFSCPECGVRLCKSCGDSAHEMFDTCEAYKSSKDPTQSERLYEKWVESANTRKCPKCSVMIEKNKGCSHMQCTRCNAHICWNCGKPFRTSESCYSHIAFCTSSLR